MVLLDNHTQGKATLLDTLTVHFQMHFYEWKVLYFDSNFTVVRFKGPIDNVSALVQAMACKWSSKWLWQFTGGCRVSFPRVLVWVCTSRESLHWRHNDRDGVSNHQPRDCLLIRAQIKENIKAPRHWPVTGEFPTQRESNAENVSIWWRHHDIDELKNWYGVLTADQIWQLLVQDLNNFKTSNICVCVIYSDWCIIESTYSSRL